MSFNIDFKNPDYLPVFKYRARLIKAITDDPAAVAYMKEFYKTHPVEFIEDWCITYDVKRQLGVIPFILFPRQKEFILWLYERLQKKEDGVVDKSREVGLTWLSCAFSTWALLFSENTKVGIGSRKEALVDRVGDPDSIFEKIRMNIRYLPAQLLPVGFDESKHMPFMKIMNPENGNTITGEAGDNIGRGGRNTIYIKDESAFYERPQKIEAALSENADVKIDISTSNGTGIPFYEKLISGEFPVFVFDWHDDPRKDQAWYEDRVRKLGRLIVAREIDRDHTSSLENVIIPGPWVEAAASIKLEGIGYKVGGFDVSGGGNDLDALVARDGPKVFAVEEWDSGGSVGATYEMISRATKLGLAAVYFDEIGVGDGASGTLARVEKPFEHFGFNAASAPSAERFNPEDDNDNRLWSDAVLNARAEYWWKLRRRFERTYLHVQGVQKFDESELISIPNHPGLKRELSSFTYKFTEGGKIKVESKSDMKKRGVKSPNLADALMMSFYEPLKAQSWTT